MFVYGIWQLQLARDDRILKLCTVQNLVEENVLTWLHLDPTCAQTVRYKREMLVREAAPLACAYSMVTIEGREKRSLVWTPSSTMRGNSVLVGQGLQNTPHWLVLSQTTTKETCNALSIHSVSFLINACPSRCSKAAIHPTTLAEAVFLSSPAMIWYSSCIRVYGQK